MTHILVLAAANPDILTDAALARFRQGLSSAGVAKRFSTGAAAEIPFVPDLDDLNGPLLARLKEARGPAAIDLVLLKAGERSKRLFLADMDSTMIGQECIDELADYVGLKSEVSAITERAMRGELEFETALRERVALLAGLPETVVEDIIRDRITPTPGGAEFLAAFAKSGGYSVLVSGGFTLFTARIAARLGFHAHRGNRLEIGRDGRLTGRVCEPILGREAKRAALIEERLRLGLAMHETLAIGDGANDLAMIGEAGLGIAFRAKPAVAAAAHARLDHADLSALIAICGLTEDH